MGYVVYTRTAGSTGRQVPSYTWNKIGGVTVTHYTTTKSMERSKETMTTMLTATATAIAFFGWTQKTWSVTPDASSSQIISARFRMENTAATGRRSTSNGQNLYHVHLEVFNCRTLEKEAKSALVLSLFGGGLKQIEKKSSTITVDTLLPPHCNVWFKRPTKAFSLCSE